MVRETRHLWVGNLPENIREDRIREHFKRYGRVQNVKILARAEGAAAGGVCATVAFMDIKSASKAHNAEHVVEERTLTTEYYEPAAWGGAAPSAGSSPAGSGYSGSSCSVTSAPARGGEESSTGATCPLAASAAAPAAWRGTNDSATDFCRRANTPAAYGRYQRNNSTAPYSTPPSNLERSTPHQRWYAGSERAGGESTPSTPGGRRRRHSGSASSRSDSSSPEPSDTSRASSPRPPPAPHGAHRAPSAHQWTSSTANGRPLSICVRNLPTRSTDSSLKDGLYHEYKKHGKVVWVKIVGQNADRYAVVRFKKPSDVEKALEVSQDKLFFGCKISVAPHQSCDDDADSTKPYETDIDEYHPKATRTLFIGNLEKDVTQQQLRDKFKHFGRIIEIDIKKGSGGGAGYAFCQYASISSVVEAIRAMDGEYVGGSRVKLGFGKPVATACVWVDGLTEHTEKQVLGAVSRCGAATSVCVDRAAGAALVHFEQACAAGAAVRELRRVAAAASAAEPDHPRLCVDYASRECQDAFYEQLEKHGGSAALAGSERLGGDATARYPASARHDSLRYEVSGSRSRASSYGRSASRTPRYTALDHYDPVDYAADRRYRVYDETGTSPPLEDPAFEDRLQSVVVSPHRARRHRRDSSPDDRKRSKERRRSAGGGVRRSRSGSAARERHSTRRRHRRRHDGSTSRAGTPLRDEPDAPPAEPRRPPRDRPPLPMCLPLPKFAAQLLRTAPQTPRSTPQSAAPDSPPRPPSVSSSSGGSAPHSPSLEERIRSLDEKYEKWSGSRALADAPDRARLRHRLLEVDINEVKPSEVVSALLAKRSVFDEDTERLECAVRAPSPGEARARTAASRLPRYPPPPPHPPPHLPDLDVSDRPSDPRLNRPERPCRLEKLGKINESDYGECRSRPRTPSVERTQSEHSDRRSPIALLDGETETRSRDSATGTCDMESKSSFDMDDKDSIEMGIKRERSNSSTSDSLLTGKSECVTAIPLLQNLTNQIEESRRSDDQLFNIEKKCTSEIMDVLLKNVENDHKLEKNVETVRKLDDNKSELFKQHETSLLNKEYKISTAETKKLDIIKNDIFCQSLSNKDAIDLDDKLHHKNSNILLNNFKIKDVSVDPEKYVPNSSHQLVKFEKENIQFDKYSDKDKQISYNDVLIEKKITEVDKNIEDRLTRTDRDKMKPSRDYFGTSRQDSDKFKNNKVEKNCDKSDKEKKGKDEQSVDRNHTDRVKTEKDSEKHYKEKTESTKLKHTEEKSKLDHHKKDRSDKDKKRETDTDFLLNKPKKEDKHKTEKVKKDMEIKKENRKELEPVKSRKSSRDESSREVCRKDSTDSSTSRTSHDSSKHKDVDGQDREDVKPRVKLTDLFAKLDASRDFESSAKIKNDSKEDKYSTSTSKPAESHSDLNVKPKAEIVDKHRHHSVDSPNVDAKRKERLNSCSSLPSNIGHKRRISSHDSFDSICDEVKKNKNEPKLPERRESKDSRSIDKHKTTKFSKGHFAKIIESKTKDDKKSQVKPPDDIFTDVKEVRKTTKEEPELTNKNSAEEAHKNLDFLALFELRSSEEDERQKALRKEMKEKKRIQQLQQIQELQMQQDAMQQGELFVKLKDDRKVKLDEKKKDAAREKRFSIDRKSRDEKQDNSKKKNRKHTQSSETSDSDEPKKHSIFDIIDDGPTYISMYDKVKARSCKNMQKQEEEKRQEKIKAKFSQLKQSRAKREEKKRSSWDEDSDSDNEVRRKPHKSSLDNSSEDERSYNTSIEKPNTSNITFDDAKAADYFNTTPDNDASSKLSRKNSRTRIISDSSDDDTSKSKSPSYKNESKPSNTISTDSSPISKHNTDEIKKCSLLNLFGKSDSDESKLKNYSDNNASYKLQSYKSVFQDLSSESESTTSIRNSGEFRRKHKKKPKRHKPIYSDDDNKIDRNDSGLHESENKHKISEKQRRHSSKKDKRKEKSRESIDTDDARDDKVNQKRDKHSPASNGFDFGMDVTSNNTKRDGKMEDIFGPLSDVSENDTTEHLNKSDMSCTDFDSIKDRINCSDTRLKDKDDLKRKRDKKRKEKRWISRDDDNSLDMDAVSKAIEARLFAESLTEEDNQKNLDSQDEIKKDSLDDAGRISKHDKNRKESREKKKKKKRSKEDRQNRKEQNHYLTSHSLPKSDSESNEKPILDAMLLDIPLPNESEAIDQKIDDAMSLESSSLPRLTESPPMYDDNKIYVDNNAIEIEQIPMPPPLENEVKDISKVPLPSEPEPIKNKIDLNSFIATLSSDSEQSEDAVRSISEEESNIDYHQDSEGEKAEADEDDSMEDRLEISSNKIEKKIEEKPRAIISQEETEDAVAALLGESFGGKLDTFSNYDESENNIEHTNENETTSLSTDNIPEEDAEEMRQAVQNLNASEMEIKPDTPVSDNDLLLIDTDNEEVVDENLQDNSEKTTKTTSSGNSSLTSSAGTSKPSNASVNTSVTKETKEHISKPQLTEPGKKSNINDNIKVQLPKRETDQSITSSATPVITSWTLTNNKILEPRVLNVQANVSSIKDKNENKTAQPITNIVQIKSTQSIPINNIAKPVLTTARVSTPYQVINHMVRPLTPNLQPPTIKIPEQHVLYQKPPGIVISPRMTNDQRLQSPKANSQNESMSSPRVPTVPVLTSPQTLNSSGMVSPSSLHHRSPGQVTVVRVQQPPLSPIQAMHLPPGTVTMVSPNRPNSVLVQTQGSPLHHNRLPVTPILTPIPKQLNVLQQNKSVAINNPPLLNQPKIVTVDARKPDIRNVPENKNENAKIILSPSSLQHSTNPTVMAQNRLISMQNAVHIGNLNSPIHLNNKFVINKMSPINEKRDQKVSEHASHSSFVSTPIIHVAGVTPSPTSIIQSNTKSIMCNVQESNNINRGPGSNVIHTLSSQRLLTPASMSNARQVDASKVSPTVLTMTTIRPSTVLTKMDPTTTTTNTNITNVTPMLIKSGAIKINTNTEKEPIQKIGLSLSSEIKSGDQITNNVSATRENEAAKKFVPPLNAADENKTKCETDFEELLKDNTNKIIIAKDPEKKVEISVGKTTTLLLPKKSEKSHPINTTCSIPKDPIVTLVERTHSEPTSLQNSTDNNIVGEDDSRKISSPQNNPVLESKALTEKLNSAASETSQPNRITSDNKEDSKPECTKNKSLNTEANKTYENVSTDKEDPSFDLETKQTLEDKGNRDFAENIENQLKALDENDSWSAKDVNIESVIKKVDSLCNDLPEPLRIESKTSTENIQENKPPSEPVVVTNQDKHSDYTNEEKKTIELDNEHTLFNHFTSTPSKRGGRGVRGKKAEKNQDRVQTRQIAKTPRGTATKRGRGRAKVDKKIKNAVANSASAMPGDVYDFHEDSGDEGAANKTEPRPRLILTIKSPLSGQAGVTVATSTLSIAQKEQTKSEERRPSREEKPEDFVSPSPNTRKSRRLQEKDVHRGVADDSGDDAPRSGRGAKRKPARQAASKPATAQDRAVDTRKSPRGAKRNRDRSLSDASVDSGDGDHGREAKLPRLEDGELGPLRVADGDFASRETKMPRLEEPVVSTVAHTPAPGTTVPLQPQPTVPVLPPAPASVQPPTTISVQPPATVSVLPPATLSVLPSTTVSVVPSATVSVLPPTIVSVPAPVNVSVQLPVTVSVQPHSIVPAQTTIVSHTAASAPPSHSVSTNVITSHVSSPSVPASTSCVRAAPPASHGIMSAAPAPTPITKPPKKMISEMSAKLASAYTSQRGSGEVASEARRGGDGATLPEAAAARVHSPALPHRTPAPLERPAPILISHRGGEGEARYRALVAGGGGAASLPRGAQHPPPPDPAARVLPVAVVGPHHHAHPPHPGSATRITSVPSISPQGQIPMGADMVRSPPPAHQQTSPIASGDGMYPHFSPQHYQMYQQHFRATQHEARTTPSPFTRIEAEGCEAPASPLELRRQSARVPRPAHSPSPADRHIMYAVKCGRSPPPAHGGAGSRAAGALPGAAPGPPHASQVPHEADSLQMLLRRYPVMWQGLLALKNDSAAVQMHFVGGNPGVASETLARPSDLAPPLLRIAQRMRLEPMQLDQVHRKMKLENEHCILLALPCGRDHMDVLQQSTNLTAGFITYLQRKQAAGIVNIAPPGHHQAMFTVHIFPSCDFANENLNRIAPDLMHRVANIAHLLIVIATV